MAKGSTPAAGPVVAVLPPSDVERAAARRRHGVVWFWLSTLALAALGAAVGWSVGQLGLGLLVGAGTGAVIGTLATLGLYVWPLVRPLWNWRTEVTTAGLLVGAAVGIAEVAGSWWWSLLLLAPTGMMGAIPWSRRRMVALVWCQITRHRLQTCFAAFVRVHNRLDPGSVPLILRVRSTPAGERVWVWLRTGLDIADLESRVDKLAVACWASSVQVVGSRRWAAMVRVDVTRRDPLTRLIGSPLVTGVPGPRAGFDGAVLDESLLGLDLADVPEPMQEAGRR
jgi:hypothetical protein